MLAEVEDRDADLGTDTETGLVDECLIVDGQAVGVAIASEYPGLRESVGPCHTHLLGGGLDLLVKHLVLRSAGNGSRAGLRQRGFRYIHLTVKRITDVVTEIHLRDTDSILSSFEIQRPFIDLNLNLQNVIPVAHSGGLGLTDCLQELLKKVIVLELDLMQFLGTDDVGVGGGGDHRQLHLKLRVLKLTHVIGGIRSTDDQHGDQEIDKLVVPESPVSEINTHNKPPTLVEAVFWKNLHGLFLNQFVHTCGDNHISRGNSRKYGHRPVRAKVINLNRPLRDNLAGEQPDAAFPTITEYGGSWNGHSLGLHVL